MRNFIIGYILAFVMFVAGFAVAATMSQPTLSRLDAASFTEATFRACDHPAGGWTTVDCTAGAAYSAALNQWSRYVIQAQSGDPYWTVATAGSGQDADSSDGTLPDKSYYEIVTFGTTKYLTCDGSADTSKLVYIECL
jgi:hypothetical protein